MNVVAQFNPATLTRDTFIVPNSSANGSMIIWNESPISLQLSFQNGDTAYVPAWMGMRYPAQPGSDTITWDQHSILASSAPPLSMVIVEVYDKGECVPGTFPVSLLRQHNVGNTVGTT